MTAPLLVFAHPAEAVAFHDVEIPQLISGVGLVNAAVTLSKRLSEGGVGEIVVLGTAGLVSDEHSISTVYHATSTTQHDFGLRTPKYWLSRHLSVPEAPRVHLASGDSFVQDDEHRERLSRSGAVLVDMETFAFAAVGVAWDIPVSVFKVPSDHANSAASPSTWDETALHLSEVLRSFFDEHLAEKL